MSVVPSDMAAAEPSHEGAQASSALFGRLFDRAERRLAEWVEGANPILIKETRQALKSRQFVVTFLIVLVACWIVTFGGVALVGPQIYYAAAGPGLLAAYFVILALPLTIIVPYSAYRSLASEQEDNTYDLLSITTLSSRQIISGKLWSAAVQMLVYFCAVSPCIAFTFLLRGVDALSVAVILAFIVMQSMGLSVWALLIGAIARVRSTQVVISVALVLGLVGAFFVAIVVAFQQVQTGSFYFREGVFWLTAAAMVTNYLAMFGLIHSAAAAQIAFGSENRSAPLRRWMLIQQTCLCGWIGGFAFAMWDSGNDLPVMLNVCILLAAAYWYVMGAMMTGEWPHLSRRVQRSLPQTTAGRLFLSFFNPGPGTGYVFAVANLTTLAAAVLILLLVADWNGMAWSWSERTTFSTVLSWSYVVIFLGIGRLLIEFFRRWAYVPLSAAFLTHLILLLVGVGIPTIVQLTSRQLRFGGYSLWQVTNPFWTLGVMWDRAPDEEQSKILMWLLPAAALATLILNMRSVASELMLHRTVTPMRVVEDETEQRAEHAKPTNPWDAEEESPT